MDYLSLKEIQNEEKAILEEVINYLDKNNIKYYMLGGTMLGAIRHKGFIPWDDDIDIAICRNDYDRLIDLLKKTTTKLNDNLEFIGFELGNGIYPFLKVINYKIALEQNINVEKYLWIDIFPLENVPEDEKEYTKFARKSFVRHELLSLKLMSFRDVFKSSKTIPRRILKICLRPFLVFVNKEKLMKKHVAYCKKYKDLKTPYIAEVAWNVLNEKKFKKSILGNKKFPFEDILVSRYRRI